MLTHVARRAGCDNDTHAAILAVGDDDQSIHEWRGVDTELIRWVNTGRANDPADGDWGHLGGYTQGRVLLFEVVDSLDEPPRIAAQIERIKRLRHEHDWTDFAVLARSQDQADTNRAFLERQGIPVRRAVRKRAGSGRR